MKRRLSKGRSAGWLHENEGVNPMEFVANLADAMLILAVGAMVALIVNWHVDIHPQTAAPKTSDNTAGAVTFTQKNLTPIEGQEQPSSDGMKKLGTVYYDEKSGTYYILGADGSTGTPVATPAPSPSPAAGK